MEKAFIDTGPFFEYGACQEKAFFEKTKRLLESPQYQWFSSTYVFDELMTLLVQRVQKSLAISFGKKLRSTSLVTWLHPSLEDEEAAWQIFQSHTDKTWSFTDCLSCHLIKKHKMKWVLSFDRDFSQMGFPLL